MTFQGGTISVFLLQRKNSRFHAQSVNKKRFFLQIKKYCAPCLPSFWQSVTHQTQWERVAASICDNGSNMDTALHVWPAFPCCSIKGVQSVWKKATLGWQDFSSSFFGDAHAIIFIGYLEHGETIGMCVRSIGCRSQSKALGDQNDLGYTYYERYRNAAQA